MNTKMLESLVAYCLRADPGWKGMWGMARQMVGSGHRKDAADRTAETFLGREEEGGSVRKGNCYTAYLNGQCKTAVAVGVFDSGADRGDSFR